MMRSERVKSSNLIRSLAMSDSLSRVVWNYSELDPSLSSWPLENWCLLLLLENSDLSRLFATSFLMSSMH